MQKLWPNEYANRRKHYDFEGEEPANSPPAGYIWNNALAAGLTVRNYGYWAVNKKAAGPDGVQIEKVNDPALIAHHQHALSQFRSRISRRRTRQDFS